MFKLFVIYRDQTGYIVFLIKKIGLLKVTLNGHI